jgi:hypothetical protein
MEKVEKYSEFKSALNLQRMMNSLVVVEYTEWEIIKKLYLDLNMRQIIKCLANHEKGTDLYSPEC